MNFLPDQYDSDNRLDVKHNYLTEQFEDFEEIFAKMKEIVVRGDFTLGREVDELELEFAKSQGAKFAIAVGSGTDAIRLSLRVAGVNSGDEVITSPYTFFATIGAIVDIGAIPVFVDSLGDGNIDPHKIEKAITSKTKAIVPIHWAGRPAEMDEISDIANTYKLKIIEDSCHATLATYKGRSTGTLGDLGAFSFHPLKNINIWGDGGIITTNNEDYAIQLKIMRSHGLEDRNTCIFYGVNSRLDTIQAVVARHMLKKLPSITSARRKNAKLLDQELSKSTHIQTIKRSDYLEEAYHLYWFKHHEREKLVQFLRSNGVDAKVHYPKPMHLQPAFKSYIRGTNIFPIAEELASQTVSLPIHEFVSENQLGRMTDLIKDYVK